MKKYRTRIITLLLAGMLAVFAPVQAWAAETDEKEVAPGISQEEDSRETGEKENASKEPEEVLEEPGEVTEPITKAVSGAGGQSDAGAAGDGTGAFEHQSCRTAGLRCDLYYQ